MSELLDQSQELDLNDINPKKLAKLGYVHFDLETGLAENGKSICLVSDEEKFILKTIRDTFKGRYPKKFNIDLRISKLDPIIFNFEK